MSLRPRYSLLTLLLLTAAVAGGIKYWRGPHWAELPYPPTPIEKAFLEEHYYLNDFINFYGAQDIRCEYTREWNDKSWNLLEGRRFQPTLLINDSPNELVREFPWYQRNNNDLKSVAYWIAPVRSDDVVVYLLTRDKYIYRFSYHRSDWLNEVELHEIPEVSVRERLAAELKRIQ